MNDSDEKAESRKELAKRIRRAAYQRAKERRAEDPKFIALKEAMKERRRVAAREANARKKASIAARKENEKVARQTERDQQRSQTDGELMKLVARGPSGPYDVN
ncbi:MAG TPA: hypothetical protein VH142_22710 [Polyangiaceae bacterium]|jgi:hypothetical protein|nr:hypothetical protein [Polyangiaceae bacterium]